MTTLAPPQDKFMLDDMMESMGFHRVDESPPPQDIDGNFTEPDDKMKLSEAMRQGMAKFQHEARNFFTMYPMDRYLITDNIEDNRGACAIGCVYWATTGKTRTNTPDNLHMTTESVMEELASFYPELLEPCEFPDGIEYMKNAVIPDNLCRLIVDLNDTWGWTRARIANWLEEMGY